MVTNPIELALTDRIEAMRRSLIGGLPFEDALEMLPVAGPPCGSGDHSSTNQARALTGSRVSNQLTIDPVDVPAFDGGFDGGTVTNYFGSWSDPKIFDLFETWKDSAKSRSDSGDDYYVTYQGVRFLFLPFGSNRGVNFKYILKVAGFTFLFFGKADSGGLPSVQVDYSYESLRGRSVFDARLEVEEFLLRLGFIPEKVTFQRLDFNITIALPFDFVNDAFNEGRVVTRVRNFSTDVKNKRNKLEPTYYRGGADLQIVIYDKLYELTKQYNEQKFNDLLPVLGEGSCLTRVEFRLFSGFFRSLDIKSFESLKERFASIVEYLCVDWFRITAKKKVRGRENKQEIDKNWQFVQYAFYKTFINKDEVQPIVRRYQHNISNSRLLAQALGCVSSALARTFDGVRNIDEFVNDVFDMCLKYKHLCYKQYQRKKKYYDVVHCGKLQFE